MTVTDQIKILNRKIKQNEAQYKISALSSNNLDKYEYLTGEDLGLKPIPVGQAKFEYSPLGKIFNKRLKEEDKKEGLFKRLENIKDKKEKLIKAFSATNKVSKAAKNKVDSRNKNLVYNSHHSFEKFKDFGEFKELSLDSMHKKLKNFHKKFTGLKSVTPQTEASKSLKEKVLDDAGDLFNDLYYIYKDKHNEEVKILNTKNKKEFDYTKLRLTDDYQYESEDEEEQQTSKKSNKEEPPIKSTKTDMDELNELIIKKEAGINKELFKKYFSFQMPTALLKTLRNLNDEYKNKHLVSVIKSGLSDFRNEIENMNEKKKKIKKPYDHMK